jgi:hypothetical protein
MRFRPDVIPHRWGCFKYCDGQRLSFMRRPMQPRRYPVSCSGEKITMRLVLVTGRWHVRKCSSAALCEPSGAPTYIEYASARRGLTAHPHLKHFLHATVYSQPELNFLAANSGIHRSGCAIYSTAIEAAIATPPYGQRVPETKHRQAQSGCGRAN